MNKKYQLEVYTLGCILATQDIDAARAIVSPKHFGETWRPTFEKLIELADSDSPIDIGRLIDLKVDLEPILQVKNGYVSPGDLGHYATELVKEFNFLETKAMLLATYNSLSAQNLYENIWRLMENLSSQRTPTCSDPNFFENCDKWTKNVQSQKSSPVLFSGLPELDSMLAPITGSRLVFLAARPGLGKTALCVQMALKSSLKGCSVAMFSLETNLSQMMPVFYANHFKLNRSLLAQNASQEIQSILGTEEHEKFKQCDIKIFDNIFELDKICTTIRELHRFGKLDFVVIDYLGLIEAHQKSNESYTNYVGRISRTLKHLTQVLEIPILLLGQLNRDCVKTKRRPELHDLRDSGNIEQDCDVVFFIHQAESDDEPSHISTREIIVAKNRTGGTGVIAAYDFNGRHQTFSSRENNVQPMSEYMSKSRGW